MVDLPLDKLLEIGWADLRKNQAHFKQVAARTRAGQRPAARCWKSWARIIPRPISCSTPSAPPSTAWSSFIRAHHIVTIPSDVRPIVEETPPFMRATTFACMDTPGPFETHATEAYFNVTLPDPSMTPAEVEGYMHAFNIGTVISTAVHEAYPGPLRAVPVAAAGAEQGAQAAWREHRRRRLGALLRADDARRRLRPAGRRARKTSAKQNCCAWASCRMRCCATRASSSASKCTPAR